MHAELSSSRGCFDPRGFKTRRTLPQTNHFWAPTRKDAHQTTFKHVMSACRTPRTAFARRPAQSRRQASRFTMLRLLALALCGESLLQSLTTTVAESGSCEQPALFAIALHAQSPRARDIAVVVSVSGPGMDTRRHPSRYKYSGGCPTLGLFSSSSHQSIHSLATSWFLKLYLSLRPITHLSPSLY